MARIVAQFIYGIDPLGFESGCLLHKLDRDALCIKVFRGKLALGLEWMALRHVWHRDFVDCGCCKYISKAVSHLNGIQPSVDRLECSFPIANSYCLSWHD